MAKDAILNSLHVLAGYTLTCVDSLNYYHVVYLLNVVLFRRQKRFWRMRGHVLVMYAFLVSTPTNWDEAFAGCGGQNSSWRRGTDKVRVLRRFLAGRYI